jgi:4-hydroxy 2-oxovalerate aldolase
LPNYISASHNAHPNYAGYLDAKKTLTFEDMNEIFDMMDEEKKISFDKKYIEELYTRFQEKDIVQEAHLSDLRERIAGQNVMVIAPGQSSISERDKIIACAKNENLIIISINYDFDEKLTDFLFVSNLRRYRDLPINKRKKCIVTSNIPSLDVYFQARYKDLINSYDAVKDNAGLMLVELLIQLGVRKIYIAGMDGYSVNAEENYAYEEMSIHTEKELVEKKNIGIMAVLKEYAKEVEIIFVTSPRHIAIT